MIVRGFYEVDIDSITYDINLDEPPEKRWQEVAECEHDLIHEYFDTMQEDLRDALDGREYSSRFLEYAAEKFLPMVLNQRSGIMNQALKAMISPWGDELIAELAGFAKAADIPLGMAIFANLIYDLTQACTPTACSSVSYFCDHGYALARNMDWVKPANLAPFSRIFRFTRHGQHIYSSLGFPGLIGVLTAWSDEWAMCINQGPQVGKPTWAKPGVLQMVRKQLDREGGAITVPPGGAGSFADMRPMSAFILHAITPTAMYAVEYPGHGFFSRFESDGGDSEGSCLIRTNHYMCDVNKQHNPDEMMWDTYDRYEALEKHVSRHARTPDPLSGVDVLKRSGVKNEGTQQIVQMVPNAKAKDDRVRIWLRNS